MIPESATDAVTLADLRLFAKAAELGGLAPAAQVLRLSKTSTTRQLQRLEAAVGRRLVLRDARRFRLTEEGLALLPHARRALAAVQEGIDSARPAAGPLEGSLRIAAPYNYGRLTIAPGLPRFMAAHPGLSIALDLGSRHADLLAGEADIAIRVGRHGSDSLVARLLEVEAFLLCATPSYLAGAPTPAGPADLAAHRFLDIRTDVSERTLELRRGGEAVRVRLTPVLSSNEPEVLAHAARQGVGIAVAPIRFVDGDLANGSLVRVLPDWSLTPREINAVYAPGRGQSRKIRTYLDYLISTLGNKDLTSA